MMSPRLPVKSVFLVSVVIALLLGNPFPYAFSQENQQSPYLRGEDLENVSKLHLRRQQATEEDSRTAQSALDFARDAADRGNWSAATKSYGDSVAIKPSIEALEGTAISISKMSRERKDCTETLIAKTRGLSGAFSYIAVALEFSKIVNEEVDLPHVYKEVMGAYRETMKRFEKCSESSIEKR